MPDYKLIKVPFPADKAMEIMNQYEACRKSPGGMEIRYKMASPMVKAGSIDGDDFDVESEELVGMGLGKLIKMPFLLQPRQFQGFRSAKEKGKSYNLVLNRKQLDQMRGSGLFKDIASIVAKIASPLLETVAPGSSESFEKVADKVIGAVDNAILRPKAKKVVKSVMTQAKREQDRVLKSDLSKEEKAHRIAKIVEDAMQESTAAAKKVMGSGDSSANNMKICSKCAGEGMVKRKQKNLM